MLVWNTRSEQATSQSATERRATYEANLAKEDLALETLSPEEPSGLCFVKVHAPDRVLKRYAEILKLRLPMKKFEHIQEIRVEDFRVPIFTDVYEVRKGADKFGKLVWGGFWGAPINETLFLILSGVQGIQSSFARFMKPFQYDERLFKRQKNELTAVFSRDKEYL